MSGETKESGVCARCAWSCAELGLEIARLKTANKQLVEQVRAEQLANEKLRAQLANSRNGDFE